MARDSAADAPGIVAALGPTNTGKTHRAIDRMLEHDTGMIGLPLRLLAREVYDRVSARLGEERVALVTGEEKRVPRRPSYWVCTVEAMPIGREVDFLAVDEIQLCAHRERGHVFTDRLLNARGRRETWFLGADTMRPIIEQLVPGVSHRRFRRLSQLRFTPRRSLRSLPPRTAVVAFSTDQVYEIAERLRRLRGGVAVVLGALSPRTRNAQVAMYQAGEVQYLVATDAIGMGLNLDVDHVAFAALRKFDGREQRLLSIPELAQIAGRAGRHLNDGTFGTVKPAPELSLEAGRAIESHRFPAIEHLVWRSTDLDLGSIDALIASLTRAPIHPSLRRVQQTDDLDALQTLAGHEEVQRLARGEQAVSLLWEVCQIPDFRKLLLHRHAGLLLEIFRQLVRGDGKLDDDWLDAQVRRVDDTRGDIDALTARLAAVRTWTYVSHRAEWLNDPSRWQERTRAIEDALGDTLHERLVERFVERAGVPARRRIRRAGDARPRERAPADGPFAQLAGLSLGDAPVEAELDEEQFVQRVVDAAHEDFGVDRLGRVHVEGESLARVVRGKDLWSPEVVLATPEDWTGGARVRLERRLLAFGRDLVDQALGGFRAEAVAGSGSAEARGLAYRLERALGVIPLGEARAQWEALDPDTRERFQSQGVCQGRRYLYVAAALSPAALERRRLMVGLHARRPVPAEVPAASTLHASAFRDRAEARLYGYELVGPAALRVDVLERLLADPEVLDDLELDAPTRTAVRNSLRRRKRRRRRRGPRKG